MAAPATGETDYDVAIVGAGPIGMTEALALANRSYRVGLFDRHDAPYPLPRAVAMSHDSVRVMQSIGLFEAIQPALDLDYTHTKVEFVAEGGEVLLSSGYAGADQSGFPSMSGFNQPDLETILEQAVRDHHGIELHRGWSATALDQDEAAVQITFDAAEGTPRTVSARYLIGADGANSTVRDLIGVGIHDLGFAADWLVVDIVSKIERTWLMLLGQKIYGRPTTYAPAGPGRRRFEFMLLPDEKPEDFKNVENVWRVLEEVDVAPDNAELVRGAIYTFRGRWAEDWRVGRVLLAGDAAHQMPPLMAQGFNSGMRDVAALAWRLDLILSGRASAAILDSYTSERLPHVQQIIHQSVGFGHLICIIDPEAQRARDAQMRAMRDAADAPALMPPPWRLGPGLVQPDDDHAGYCGVQGRATIHGETALLDDLIGFGRFVLIARGTPALSDAALAIWRTLDGVVVDIAPGGGVDDIDGTYAKWLDGMGAAAAIMRPDFQVYGTAADLAGADALVRALGRQLELRQDAAAVAA